MTLAAATETDELSLPDARAEDDGLRNALWWHCGWALALALGVVGLSFATTWTNWTPGLALIIGAAPAIVALVALRFEADWSRVGLLVVWAAAGALAADLTGGLSGPLALWCAAAIGPAVLLGGRKVSWGAAFSLLALASVALAQAGGLTPPAPSGALAAGLALIGVGATILGLGAAVVMARSTDSEPVAADNGLADAQPDLIVVLSEAGRVEVARGSRLAELGHHMLGHNLIGLVPPSERPAVEQALATALAEGRASVRFPLEDSSGEWFGLDLARMGGDRLIGLIRDATADHDREKALGDARIQAEALNIGKSRFLANMSHELRTPLNAIMGFSDIMRERIFGPLPPKYAEYADLIHDAGAHLLDLINDVLDMSKIEASKYELALEFFDAREPVSAALRLMRLQADDAGVQLRGLLPNSDLDVEADRRALKQIVLNLVSNALKFTPRGGLVTVSLASVGEALELSVADTGVGIAEGDLARLGRPYEQAGDAGQQAQGTGLGLSLVRAFAELHGGEMSIESRLGEGTAVSVRLPVLAAPASEPEVPSPPSIGAEVIAFKPQR